MKIYGVLKAINGYWYVFLREDNSNMQIICLSETTAPADLSYFIRQGYKIDEEGQFGPRYIRR